MSLFNLLKAVANKITDRGEPCGIPLLSGCWEEYTLLDNTVIFRFVRKLEIYLIILGPIFHSMSSSIML